MNGNGRYEKKKEKKRKRKKEKRKKKMEDITIKEERKKERKIPRAHLKNPMRLVTLRTTATTQIVNQSRFNFIIEMIENRIHESIVATRKPQKTIVSPVDIFHLFFF